RIAPGRERPAELPGAHPETTCLRVLVGSLEGDDHHFERVGREHGTHSLTASRGAPADLPSGTRRSTLVDKKRAKDRLAGAGDSAHSRVWSRTTDENLDARATCL